MITQILLSASIAYAAGEVITGKPSLIKEAASNPSVFGKYLLCINSLHPPFARHLTFSGTSRFPRSENDTAVFFGKATGKAGILMVKPDVATLDEVPQYKPQAGNPEYPISVIGPDGQEYLSHYYIEDGRGRAVGIGPAGQSEFRDANANIPFYRLGKPASKISEADAISALATEAIPPIESIPDTLAGWESFVDLKRWGPDRRNGARKQAREALCNCIKTGHGAIVAAAIRVSANLKFGDMKDCGDQMVSGLERWLGNLLPKAMAVPKMQSDLPHQSLQINFDDPQQKLIINNDKLQSCSANRATAVEMVSGRLKITKGGCTRRNPEVSACGKITNLRDTIKDSLKSCATVGHQTIAGTVTGTYIYDSETKDSTLIDDLGADVVAYSGKWMAWGQGSIVRFRR